MYGEMNSIVGTF